MEEGFRQTVFETLSEVFETMYFTFLEPVFEMPGAEELEKVDGYYEARISFRGSRSGTFRFYLPRRLARNITVNFLGVDDEDVNESQVLDTVKETANMATGSLLGKIDPGGTLKLGLPESREAGAVKAEVMLSNPDAFLFNTEYGPLWVVYEQ